jgi:hypothetical protein
MGFNSLESDKGNTDEAMRMIAEALAPTPGPVPNPGPVPEPQPLPSEGRWLKLVRSGNVFTAFTGQDGTNWQQIGQPQTVQMSTAVSVGLAVTSHTNSVVSTAVFDSVTVNDVPVVFKSSTDIGNIYVAGKNTYENGVYRVAGSGGDIWGQSDHFRFVAGSASGDTTVIARITSQENTHAWAKAGIMFRENSRTTSQNTAVLLTPSSGTLFQWRSVNNGVTSSSVLK